MVNAERQRPGQVSEAEFPYADLVRLNRARGKSDPEYELLDTGVFDGNRYFDVVVECAKAMPEDLLMQVTMHNRGAGGRRAACAAHRSAATRRRMAAAR